MTLRLYTFVNFYMSSIQQGIQSMHVASELTSKYRGKRSSAAKMLKQWENFDKTSIVLNGGMACDLYQDNLKVITRSNGKYPFAEFHEEVGAMHQNYRALTAWGIVLPSEIYNARPKEEFPAREGFQAETTDPFWTPGSFEHMICSILQGKQLAR